MSYNNLPGVQVFTVDGGLVARRAPRAKSTLVIGTAAMGPANEPFQVVDRAAAALTFGFDGNVVRAMEEVATYSDNIILFRMGTKRAALNGVGTDTTVGTPTPGFSIKFSQVTANAATRYQIWYKAGVLAVWLDGQVIYSNDPGLGLVDTGDLEITGVVAGNNGLVLGTGASPLLSAAITLTAAAALTGTATTPAVTLVQPVTGVGMSQRAAYVALAQAFDLLEIYPVDQVYCPSAVLDNPNVAFYVSSDATTAVHNPVTNTDALDWMKSITAADGSKTYQWANDVTDSAGNAVTAMGVVADGAARIAAGFREVNFGYLVSDFCAAQGLTQTGCIGFIGTQGPRSYKLADTRSWVGFLPTYDANGVPTASGSGMLGIPYLVGCTSGKLNPLCADKATYRKAGFFQNSAEAYDGGADIDINQNPVDIGAYLHVVGDRAGLTNGFASQYETNLAGIVCGLVSMLDEKSSTTNKPLNAIQLWKPAQSQLDALTFAKVNTLRFRNIGDQPVLLHGFTAATQASDYISLLRQRIKFLVVKIVNDEAQKFIGESSLDGLQLSAMKTALESRAVQLQKRGYVSYASFDITTTDVEQRIGHARIDIKFTPADELVQLRAYVGVVRR